jgi:hypothetical protein
MESFENLPPIVVLVLGFVLIAWLVLVFLVPFMIESIRQSARKTHEELADMNAKLDRLSSLLAQGGHSGQGGRAKGSRAEPTIPEPPEGRGRREPTISETAVRQGGRTNRREPTVR